DRTRKCRGCLSWLAPSAARTTRGGWSVHPPGGRRPSFRDSATRSAYRRRCPRDAVTPRRLPAHLLLSERILPPSYQHGALHHYEEIDGADETAPLERTDHSTGAREDVEGELRPEEGSIWKLAPQKPAGDQTGQQQERHDEAQELVARQLKREAAVTKRGQEG